MKYTWTPFEPSESYEHPEWWANARGAVGDPWFVQALENGVEIARVQLDERGGIGDGYTDAPAINAHELLEIQFIEVTTTARRRGVATRVVQALTEQHPDKHLMAYSEGADAFWESLGWDPFYDLSPGPPGRTLYIQPAR